MPNMSKVISSHNTKVSRQDLPLTAEQRKLIGCNCQAAKRNGIEACPMRGECCRDKITYQATVTRSDTGQTSTYTGLSEPSFKFRYNNHKSSFNLRHKAEDTELSKYIWKLKDENICYKLTWQKLGRAQSYNPGNRICRLCLLEKYFIMFKPNGATLNN